MQKLNLHPSLLSWDITLKILPSDWSKVFRPIYREPELCQIWGLWGNTSNNMIFHFRLFQGKTDVNIFLKLQKGPVFWPIFGSFLANQNYSEKSVLDQFFPVLGRYYCAKFQKNWSMDSEESWLQTQERTDWQTWIYRTLLASAGSKMSSTNQESIKGKSGLYLIITFIWMHLMLALLKINFFIVVKDYILNMPQWIVWLQQYVHVAELFLVTHIDTIYTLFFIGTIL